VRNRVDSLRKQLAGLSTLEAVDDCGMTTGCESLDRLLPGGSLRTGMLIELLSADRGSGAGALAMHFAKQAVAETRGCLVVTDRWRRFYPPAAVARGIETKDLIVVRSSDATVMSSGEELWALDQALRCTGVGVVLAWIDKVEPLAFRRLQLAAETGQTLALLLRPTCVRAQPTWSDVQLMVRPRDSDQGHDGVASTSNENRFCRVTLLRQRGRAGNNTPEGTSVELEIDEQQGTLKGVHRRHETRTMHLAPRVAHSAARCRSAGA
jgi:protein ImuA